jgi:hypothetical protein
VVAQDAERLPVNNLVFLINFIDSRRKEKHLRGNHERIEGIDQQKG